MRKRIKNRIFVKETKALGILLRAFKISISLKLTPIEILILCFNKVNKKSRREYLDDKSYEKSWKDSVCLLSWGEQ